MEIDFGPTVYRRWLERAYWVVAALVLIAV
jgi:hypothetical protein